MLKKQQQPTLLALVVNYCEKRTFFFFIPKMIKLGITNRLKTCHYVPPDVLQCEINVTHLCSILTLQKLTLYPAKPLDLTSSLNTGSRRTS